jgi:hypothetical protein
MKKIIAAFDGLKFSESARDYALDIAKQTHTHLVGVFMDDPSYTSYKIYELIGKEGVSAATLNTFEAKDQSTRDAAAKNFEKACQKQGIEYTIHHDRKIAIQALKHESIYCDLLIIHKIVTGYRHK